MDAKIIDLNDSPSSPSPSPTPSPPCSRRSSRTTKDLKLKASTTSRKRHVKNKKSSSSSWTHNPSTGYFNLQWFGGDLCRQPYGFSQITGNLQPTQHASAQPLTVVDYEPKPNAFLFPQGMKLKETWTPKEHEQFLMEDDMGAPPTLMLFPVDAGKASSNNNNPYAFERLDMKTTRTDVVAVEDEADLELRLGQN